MIRRLLLMSAAISFMTTCSLAQDQNYQYQQQVQQQINSMPQYKPEQQVSGTIRSWGDEQLVDLMKTWEEGFQKYQPDVKFYDFLKSSAAAIGPLYSGVADLGFMGREIYPVELIGFQRVFLYKPTGIDFMTGSYDAESKTFPMMLFVNKANPLKEITMQQLDAIFGVERKLGAKENLRTWGQLGLTGEWANKPIHPMGYAIDSGFAFFFGLSALGGGLKWNPDFRAFDPIRGPDGKTIVPGRLSLEALSRDPYAIDYSNVRYVTPDLKVKALAVAKDEKGPYVAPTRSNVQNGSYPLTRAMTVWLNRAPGKPIDPKVREFLRYILSREGQATVANTDFLPLTPNRVEEELRKLE